MNEITWHESAIWFFIAQKLLFANQYVRKFHKISKFSTNFKIFNKFQNFHKISKLQN
jgi:hypothetical protein